MTGLTLTHLALIGAAIGVAPAFWLPRWLENRPSARIRRRLAGGRRRPVPATRPGPTLFARVRTNAAPALLDPLATTVRRLGGASFLRTLAVVAAAAAAAGGVALAGFLGPFAPLTTAAIASGAAAAAAAFVWRHLLRKWELAFLDGFADAIDLATRAVRSGLPVTEAIRAAAREVNEPVRGEFEQIAHALDLGIDLKEAMRGAARRVRLPDFDFLTVAIVIQRESGGQLADTLDGLSTILRRRKELRLKTKALTAEGRMSAAIVAAMPVLSGGATYVIDPNYVRQLFETPTGRTMAHAAAGALVLGLLVVRHLTRVKP